MRRLLKIMIDFRRSLKDLFVSSKHFKYTTLVSVLFVILSFILPAWRILPLVQDKPYLPLHYNIYFGIDSFGPWYSIFFPAVLGLSLLLINIGFEAVFLRREHILSIFFAIATICVEIILFISVVLIVLLNI